MEIDTSTWKEFRIGDLFTVELAKGDIKFDEMALGNVALVSSGETNNGIVGYISSIGDGKSEIFPSNRITVDMFGNAFYQSNPFYAVSHGRVNILNPKFDMTDTIGLFITSVIKQEQYKYSYGRAVYSSVAENIIIKLPATSTGEPDWQYMEDFIKSLHYKPLTTQNKMGQAHDLNVRDWKAFNIQRTSEQAGLFVIENCKCGSAGELEDGSDINYIGAKKSDNGVMRSVVYDEKLVSKGHGIMFICDGEGSVGYTNYMDKDFIGSTTTSIGYDEALTETNAMFLVTVLDNEKFKYSYGRKYRTHMIEAQIYLPIQLNADGTPCIDNTHKYSDDGYVPDWQYMEDYIKSLPYGDKLGVFVEKNVPQRKCKKNA